MACLAGATGVAGFAATGVVACPVANENISADHVSKVKSDANIPFAPPAILAELTSLEVIPNMFHGFVGQSHVDFIEQRCVGSNIWWAPTHPTPLLVFPLALSTV